MEATPLCIVGLRLRVVPSSYLDLFPQLFTSVELMITPPALTLLIIFFSSKAHRGGSRYRGLPCLN